MNTAHDDLLTIKEAASILRVHPSTIRRWIVAGELRAYRVGRKRLCLRRSELQPMVRPTRERWRYVSSLDELRNAPPATAEERARAVKVVDLARASIARQLAERGGVPYPDSVELLHELREERYGGDR